MDPPVYTVVRSVVILDDPASQDEWVKVMDTKFNMTFTVHRSEILGIQDRFTATKRARSPEMLMRGSPSIQEIPSEQGESSIEQDESVSTTARPSSSSSSFGSLSLPKPSFSFSSAPPDNILSPGKPVFVRIQLELPEMGIKAGFAYKNFRTDKVLFIKSPDIMTKKQMLGLVQAVGIKFAFKTTIETIEADVLKSKLLQQSKFGELSDVRLPKLTTDREWEKSEYDTEEQEKYIQRDRNMKRVTKQRDAELKGRRPAPFTTEVAAGKTSFIDSDNGLFVSTLKLSQSTPYVEKTIVSEGTRLELDNLREVYNYDVGKTQNRILMQTFDSEGAATYRVTFLIKDGRLKQLVGIVIYHADTLVGSKYVCGNCNKRITGVVQACGHCRNVTYCGIQCAKEHWPTHKEI